jgi:hypothetical protein
MKESYECLMTVKYSPEGEKFASGGNDLIRVWSKDGGLETGHREIAEQGAGVAGGSAVPRGTFVVVIHVRFSRQISENA